MGEPVPLPPFRCYPDPLAGGSVKADPDTPCLSCNRIRGYVYSGPVYITKNFILDEHLCPWCIADGTAAKKFGATFNDAAVMENVSAQVIDEITRRTPGFEAWQQPQWLSCCKDAAAYLGTAGAAELRRDFPNAVPVVMQYLRDEFELSGRDLQEFFDMLSKEDMPTAYVFRCLHCHRYLATVDQT